MKSVDDIMIKDVFVMQETEMLFAGRAAMRERNIRHLPVVNAVGEFSGLLTQRVVLQEDIKIIDKYGFEKLEVIEQRVPIANVMIKSAYTVPRDAPLDTAAEYLIEDKHGCLMVVEGNKVVGILTSMDFVKLAIDLLKDTETA